MRLEITCELSGEVVESTENIRAVGKWFGVRPESRRRLFVPRQIAIEPGTIVLVKGFSGSGKSTLLRAMGNELELRDAATFWTDEIPLSESAAVVDSFGDLDLKNILQHLARAGLADARTWLRRPAELSEGQRFRYRLARWFASGKTILLADAFAEGLDAITAKIVSYQLRKFVTQSRRCAVVATVREDIEMDLAADVVVRMDDGA